MGWRDRVTTAANKASDPAKIISSAVNVGQKAATSGYSPAVVVGAAAIAGAASVAMDALVNCGEPGNPYDHVGFDPEPRDVTNTPSGVEVRWRR